MLDNWSLNITPVITVTPVNPRRRRSTAAGPGRQHVHRSASRCSSSAAPTRIQIGPEHPRRVRRCRSIPIQNAGLAVLRGQGQNGPTTTVTYTATDLPDDPSPPPTPAARPSGHGELHDHRPRRFHRPGRHHVLGASGLQVQINLTYPDDPDLSATLYYDYGPGRARSRSRCSAAWASGSTTANFTNTIFDDNAATPIQNGAAPFFATFNPQMSLAAFAGPGCAQGTWTLVITNNSATGAGAPARSTAGR